MAVDREPRALVTDWEFEDLGIEQAAMRDVGVDLAHAQCRTPEQVISAAQEHGAQALLVQYAPINGDVIRSLPELQLVARYGVGVDNVDLEAARECGVMVCNATSYGDEEVAAHAAALALAAIRGLPFHDRDVRAGGWDYKRARPIPRVGDLTLGVLGLGRIGQLAAGLLGPFFGQVVGYDPFLPDERWPDGVERLELDAFLARSNVVSLHLPLSDDTRDLVDDALLGKLPQEAILVNTARGGLVDEEAVVRALDRGQLAVAALDVLQQEPAPADHPLRTHPRALITPHGAWYSSTSEVVLRRMAAGNVAAWATGQRPNDVVVDPA